MKAYFCAPDQVYQTPPGYWDQAYIYAYNTDAIADGINILNLAIPVEGNAEFRCRKIDGSIQVVNPLTGQLLIHDRLSRPCSDRPLYAGHLRSVAVVPERYYPPGSQILFNLYTTLRAANAVPPDTTFLSQIAFRGIHRRAGPELIETRYPFKQKPFIITAPLTVNWLSTAALPTQLQVIPVNNYDFELHAIRVYVMNNGAIPGPGILLKMRVYDALERSLSNVPLLMDFWLENSETFLGNVFSPAVLYPAGCEIRYEIESLALPGQIPLNYEIEFLGVRRFPIWA